MPLRPQLMGEFALGASSDWFSWEFPAGARPTAEQRFFTAKRLCLIAQGCAATMGRYCRHPLPTPTGLRRRRRLTHAINRTPNAASGRHMELNVCEWN